MSGRRTSGDQSPCIMCGRPSGEHTARESTACIAKFQASGPRSPDATTAADHGAHCVRCGHYETSYVHAVATYAHCPSCGRHTRWEKAACPSCGGVGHCQACGGDNEDGRSGVLVTAEAIPTARRVPWDEARKNAHPAPRPASASPALGETVTATLGFVSPAYHVDVRDRLEAENAALRAEVEGLRRASAQPGQCAVCLTHDVGVFEAAVCVPCLERRPPQAALNKGHAETHAVVEAARAYVHDADGSTTYGRLVAAVEAFDGLRPSEAKTSATSLTHDQILAMTPAEQSMMLGAVFVEVPEPGTAEAQPLTVDIKGVRHHFWRDEAMTAYAALGAALGRERATPCTGSASVEDAYDAGYTRGRAMGHDEGFAEGRTEIPEQVLGERYRLGWIAAVDKCAEFLETADVRPGTPTQWAGHLRLLRTDPCASPACTCGAPRGSDHGILCPVGRSTEEGEVDAADSSSSDHERARAYLHGDAAHPGETAEDELVRLLADVRRETIEACARVCEAERESHVADPGEDSRDAATAAEHCAAMIRALQFTSSATEKKP